MDFFAERPSGGAQSSEQEPTISTPDIITTIATSLRRERERAGLSLTELARRAKLAKSTLSQLESGTGNPSVETLWALSLALRVPFSRLVEPPLPPVHVIRADEGPYTRSEEAPYGVALLSPCPPGARRDLFRIVAEPGAPRLTTTPHQAGVREHVVLAEGRALVGPVDATVELDPGDYVCYPGDTQHIFEALAPGTTAVMIIEQT
ncbi:XRE family transcriptional regulator [Actinocorallia herbida]|uniref:XRE family transcriptional regulator n=1 Tax=Actinocorallia herbida TaxID=58109 RepID=A0A3N1CTN3_9ACTN|nr:XRE family transcriptional regulator [Actinocorallia herbida]ROO84666.1 XRE family transcriptional regulator [Actinocorallia herbida]